MPKTDSRDQTTLSPPVLGLCPAHTSTTDRSQQNPRLSTRNLPLGELVRIVKKDKATFPNGLKTKLSLGDFEGNTYHRKFSVGTDDGRLYLTYELNERDE